MKFNSFTGLSIVNQIYSSSFEEQILDYYEDNYLESYQVLILDSNESPGLFNSTDLQLLRFLFDSSGIFMELSTDLFSIGDHKLCYCFLESENGDIHRAVHMGNTGNGSFMMICQPPFNPSVKSVKGVINVENSNTQEMMCINLTLNLSASQIPEYKVKRVEEGFEFNCFEYKIRISDIVLYPFCATIKLEGFDELADEVGEKQYFLEIMVKNQENYKIREKVYINENTVICFFNTGHIDCGEELIGNLYLSITDFNKGSGISDEEPIPISNIKQLEERIERKREVKSLNNTDKIVWGCVSD